MSNEKDFRVFEAITKENPYYVINSIYGTHRIFSLAIFQSIPSFTKKRVYLDKSPEKIMAMAIYWLI